MLHTWEAEASGGAGYKREQEEAGTFFSVGLGLYLPFEIGKCCQSTDV